MSESVIRSTLYSAVGTVATAGKVYDYERWAANWPDFLNLFKTTINGTAQIRGWEVVYRGAVAARDPQFPRFKRHTHTFWLQGYMGVKDGDATEKEFAVLAHLVVAAVDANATLHSGVYKFTEPASLEEFAPRTFDGVLCHYARIVVVVPEQVS